MSAQSETFKLIAGLIGLLNLAFIWFYDFPVNSDVGLHVQAAQVIMEEVSGSSDPDSPFAVNWVVSSYVVCDWILAAFVWLAGPVSGAKIALTVYIAAFMGSAYWLVGAIAPESTWSRIAIWPLALNYFFHWGFWPYLLALAFAMSAVAASESEQRRSGLAASAALRFLTAVCHPIPAVSVGAYDVARTAVAVLLSGQIEPGQGALRLLKLWWSSGLLALWIVLDGSVGGGPLEWGSVREQGIQLLRPFYLTRHPLEQVLPLAALAGLIGSSVAMAWRTEKAIQQFIPALTVIALGLLIPRENFLASWETGTRVIFMGVLVLIAVSARFEASHRRVVIVWLVCATLTNTVASHMLWSSASRSAAQTISAIANMGPFDSVEWSRDPSTISSIELANNIGPWLWTLGHVSSTKTLLSYVKHSPIRRRSESTTEDSLEPKVPDVGLLYHPDGRTLPVDARHVIHENELYTVWMKSK